MQEIKIMHAPSEKEPYAVVYKPSGLPSAPLGEGDIENAFSRTAEFFPECREVHGRKKIECGLLHRLDTETSGLLLVAAEQAFYDFMQTEQDAGRFLKKYRAECDVFPENPNVLGGFPPSLDFTPRTSAAFTVESFFRNFGAGGREVRPVTVDSGKSALKKLGTNRIYRTGIRIALLHDGKAEVECSIVRGYRHQVRCHLAWLGLPVECDGLYNSRCAEPGVMKFFATEIQFRNPRTDEEVVYSV